MTSVFVVRTTVAVLRPVRPKCQSSKLLRISSSFRALLLGWRPLSIKDASNDQAALHHNPSPYKRCHRVCVRHPHYQGLWLASLRGIRRRGRDQSLFEIQGQSCVIAEDRLSEAIPIATIDPAALNRPYVRIAASSVERRGCGLPRFRTKKVRVENLTQGARRVDRGWRA